MIGVELLDRGLDQRPAALGADDHPGADLAQLDPVGHLDHAVKQTEARVGDVVEDALPGQSELVLHAGGRGRFEIIAAN